MKVITAALLVVILTVAVVPAYAMQTTHYSISLPLRNTSVHRQFTTLRSGDIRVQGKFTPAGKGDVFFIEIHDASNKLLCSEAAGGTTRLNSTPLMVCDAGVQPAGAYDFLVYATHKSFASVDLIAETNP